MPFSKKSDISESYVDIGKLCLDRFQENAKGIPPNYCSEEQLLQLQVEMRENADVYSVVMKDEKTLKVWAGTDWKLSASKLVRRLPYELTKPFSDTKSPIKEYCKANGFSSYKDCAIGLLPSAHYTIKKNTEHYLT